MIPVKFAGAFRGAYRGRFSGCSLVAFAVSAT